MTLINLLTNLHEATEGSHELDKQIAEHLGLHPCWSYENKNTRRLYSLPTGNSVRAWTSSVEIARHMIPVKHQWSVGTTRSQLGFSDRRFVAYCQPDKSFRQNWYYGYTPALALCLAIINVGICK